MWHRHSSVQQIQRWNDCQQEACTETHMHIHADVFTAILRVFLVLLMVTEDRVTALTTL